MEGSDRAAALKAPTIVAVDGGGTSATFLACDADGVVLARAVTGPTSQKAAGEAAATAELARGFSLLAQQGVDPCRAQVVVCGLSGYDSPASMRVQEGMLDVCGIPRERRVLCSDGLLPLFATGLDEGAVLIAGTGSVAVGLDAAGRIHRCGGWGYEWSDAGSGRWMGARALEGALEYRDGMREHDALFDRVLEIAGAATYDELAWWAVDGPSAAQVARIAPAVLEGASPQARAVRDEAAAALARLYGGLVRRMVAGGAEKPDGLAEHDAPCASGEPDGPTRLRDYNAPGEPDAPGAFDAPVAAGARGAVPADLVLSGGLFSSNAFSAAVERGILALCGECAPRIVLATREPALGAVEVGRRALAGRLPSFSVA